MSRSNEVTVLAAVVLCVGAAVLVGVSPTAAASRSTDSSTNQTGRVVEVYPNPVPAGDPGEYVVVRLPDGPARWTLSDGETTFTFPSNASGSVAVVDAADAPLPRLPPAKHPGRPRVRTINTTDAPALANDGERLALARNGTVVDEVRYDAAPEGERWLRDADPRWHPLGYTPRPVVSTGPATVEAFVLPDAPGVPVETIRGADERVLLAGYTFTSRRVAGALASAQSRGLRVRVLVDGGPVGGMSARQARVLDRLVARGVEVRVLSGPWARYRFHHAKYAVVDDRALVLTENWKPAGTGGADSRGWGVVVHSAGTARALASVFNEDVGWRDAVPWRQFRRTHQFHDSLPANGSYPRRAAPKTVRVEDVRLATAPGNAEATLESLVENATTSVDVLQPTIGGRDQSLLGATIRAAERGVAVRILLSNAWYVSEENRALVEWLETVADRRDLPLEARVARPAGRYGKIHAKGLVVDERVVALGSANWNRASLTENREVVVVLEGEAVAAYFRDVFDRDWRTGGSLPLLLVAAALGALALAVLVARRTLEFDPNGREGWWGDG